MARLRQPAGHPLFAQQQEKPRRGTSGVEGALLKQRNYSLRRRAKCRLTGPLSFTYVKLSRRTFARQQFRRM